MSEYIHFFARKNNEFASLYSESRSGRLMKYLGDYAPWEKICKLTPQMINEAIDCANNDLVNIDENINSVNDRISFLEKCNANSLEERMEIFDEYHRDLIELDESRKEILSSLEILKFLRSIIMENKHSIAYENYPVESGIYVGIECGVNVTIDDIKESTV